MADVTAAGPMRYFDAGAEVVVAWARVRSPEPARIMTRVLWRSNNRRRDGIGLLPATMKATRGPVARS